MARNKNNTLNPTAYGLTVQEATRLIRIHDLCKGMDEDAFEQMETAARSINLVNSLTGGPWRERSLTMEKTPFPTTLDELETYPQQTLTAEQVAQFLGCSVQSIRSQAQIDAGALGFPVILYGSTIRIPRLGFIYFMRYGRTSVQKRSYK